MPTQVQLLAGPIAGPLFCIFGDFLSGPLALLGYRLRESTVWLCCQTSALLQLITNRSPPTPTPGCQCTIINTHFFNVPFLGDFHIFSSSAYFIAVFDTIWYKKLSLDSEEVWGIRRGPGLLCAWLKVQSPLCLRWGQKCLYFIPQRNSEWE